MAALSLPTKNQFAFTHVVAPTGDEMITIGHNFFLKKKDTAQWEHKTLADYFVGQTLKTDEEKHDAVTFPIDSFDQHFFTEKGVEVIVAGGLLYYRAYPAESIWHVTDHPSTDLSNATETSSKRLLINPIAHIALESNTMFVDSGNSPFEFTLEDAPQTPQNFRCKSCHESFSTVEYARATTICSHCSCSEMTRLT